MIPQPFVKGAGERVFFGQFEYPTGADLIFDFGNPLSNAPLVSGSYYVNNAATTSPAAAVTASLIPYNNPGPIYPTYETTNGGTLITRAIAGNSNYLQWNWKSTAEQTNVFIFKLNGTQLNPWSSFLPQEAGASSIRANIYGNTTVTGSASLDVRYYNTSNVGSDIFSTTLNVDANNTRNGYNLVGIGANASTYHALVINQTTPSVNTTSIGRSTSGTQTTNFGVSSNMRLMAFLQYPKILTPKEWRQIYKVFAPRFFT